MFLFLALYLFDPYAGEQVRCPARWCRQVEHEKDAERCVSVGVYRSLAQVCAEAAPTSVLEFALALYAKTRVSEADEDVGSSTAPIDCLGLDGVVQRPLGEPLVVVLLEGAFKNGLRGGAAEKGSALASYECTDVVAADQIQDGLR